MEKFFRKIASFFFPFLEAHYAVLCTILETEFYVGEGLTFEEAVSLADKWQEKYRVKTIIEDMR